MSLKVMLRLVNIGKMRPKLIRLATTIIVKQKRNYFKRMADRKVKSMKVSKNMHLIIGTEIEDF